MKKMSKKNFKFNARGKTKFHGIFIEIKSLRK